MSPAGNQFLICCRFTIGSFLIYTIDKTTELRFPVNPLTPRVKPWVIQSSFIMDFPGCFSILPSL